MSLGLIGTSLRENEFRLPLHPRHLPDIPARIRQELVVERGYGERYGMSDRELEPLVGSLAPRDQILRHSDVVILAKPMEQDLYSIREGGVLWGWLHFVLYGDLADIAVERRLTVITWEGMYEAEKVNGRRLHTFGHNNELAGYAGVLHALGRAGIDGRYGPPRRAVVIGHGYAGRASVVALQAAGFQDITVYTQRNPAAIPDAVPGARYGRYAGRPDGGGALAYDGGGATPVPFVSVLREADIIVNCSVQDPEAPVMFVTPDEVAILDHPCLIVDISCDPGMGFPFARTTTFERPTFRVGRMTVCAVDHTPGYLWDAASWGISQALIPHLETIAGGRGRWRENPTIADAIEIEDGMILNRKILSYQDRLDAYPFPRRSQEAVRREQKA